MTDHHGDDRNIMCNESQNKYSLPREKIDPGFREPFIVKGYRKPNMAALDCLRSTLHNCNETANVWTHLLPFIYFAVKFWNYFSNESTSGDPFLWPLMCSALGMLLFCLMSAIAHTFSSMSLITRNTCFCLDYAAISIYSVGAGQAFYFYSRPLKSALTVYQSAMLFSIVSVVVSVACTAQCCLTRLRKDISCIYLIRTLSFTMPFLTNASPFLYRMFVSTETADTVKDAFPIFFAHIICYILGALVNVTKLPESVKQGVFDTFGQSHNLMHLFTAIGAGLQWDAIRIDMLNRKDILQTQVIQSDAGYSFWYMLVAIVLNCVVALWFGLKDPPARKDSKKMN